MKKKGKETTKEIGIWTVTYWILMGLAGAASIFSGIVTIKAGQFFIGLIFLVLTIFVFVPRKYLRISRPLKVVIFILAYFVLLIISGINAPKPEQQYEYYNLEQSFNLTFGNNVFLMTIYNVSTKTQLIVDGQNVSSSGIYIIVNGGIKNLGKSPSDFSFKSELRDSEDNLYTLFAFNMVGGQLQPRLEREFSNIFEIPEQSSGLKFIVEDQTNIIKIVNLGI